MTVPFTNAFAAFRHRNYRLWFAGQLISLVGTWMQNVAQGYLLYTLTGSAATLGAAGFLAGAPSWLLILYGGVLADRLPRRMLLVATQAAKMVLALLLAGLVFAGRVQPWHVLALALGLGVANAFDAPARKALVVDLVARADLTNAIALGDAMYNISVIAGPAAGAAVYALAGPGWCFLLNGLTFLAVIAALLRMRIPAAAAAPAPPAAPQALAEALRYVRGSRLVRTLNAGEFLISVLGYGPIVLLPAWAVTVLRGDVATNGLLLSVHGAGAVLGGLLIAALAGRGRPRGAAWTAGSVLLPLALAAFAAARGLPASLACLALMGLAQVIMSTNNSALIQSNAPDALRGRVMGLYTLMYVGGEPLAALGAGLLAERIGAAVTFYACAAGLLLFALLVWLRHPEVRRAV